MSVSISICFPLCTTELLLCNFDNEHSNTPNQQLLKTHTHNTLVIIHFENS